MIVMMVMTIMYRSHLWWLIIDYTGLRIFHTVAELRNSGKSANPREIHKNMQNTAKFARNLIKYMSVQQFWNFSQLLGVFTCRELANLCQNIVTETCKQRTETTRRRLCCEKLGTSHDVKGFAIGSFLVLLLKEQMMTSFRKTLKTLVWSVQNQSISSEICPENNHKICRVFTDSFLTKFAQKILAKFPRNWADFSAILSLKIPRNLTFFSATYQKPWLYAVSNFVILNPILKTIYTDILIVSPEKWHSWMIPTLSLLIFVTPASSLMIPVSVCM